MLVNLKFTEIRNQKLRVTCYASKEKTLEFGFHFSSNNHENFDFLGRLRHVADLYIKHAIALYIILQFDIIF